MRTRRTTFAIVALAMLAALTLALAACGSSTSSSSSSSPGTGTPKSGGTLNVTFQGEPTELDPAIAWEVESWSIERLTYQTFLTYASKSGEAGTQLVPDLATEVPTAANGGISADGKVYTFHIKKGIKFAPPISTDVTAADFKWSFQRMMKAPLAPATFFYTGIVGAQDYIDGKASAISGFKVVDPLHRADHARQARRLVPLRDVDAVHLGDVQGVVRQGRQADQAQAARHRPVHDHQLDARASRSTRSRTPTSRARASRASSTSTTCTSSSRPTRARRCSSSSAARWTCSATPSRRPTTCAPRRARSGASTSSNAPQIMWFYTFMNVLEKPFDNVKVRQAINYAIDTQKIQKLLAGQATSLNQIYPKGMPGHQDGKTYYTYDPAKAKQLLAEAGFPNGFKTTFYADNVDPMPKLAQSVQNDLAAVGITAVTQAHGPRHLLELHLAQEVARRHRLQRLVPWTSRTRATGSARCSPTRSTAAPTPASTRTRR